MKIYLAGVAPGKEVRKELQKTNARRLFSYYYLEHKVDNSHLEEWNRVTKEEKK